MSHERITPENSPETDQPKVASSSPASANSQLAEVNCPKTPTNSSLRSAASAQI